MAESQLVRQRFEWRGTDERSAFASFVRRFGVFDRLLFGRRLAFDRGREQGRQLHFRLGYENTESFNKVQATVRAK
jgi:hypothetical protein